MNLKKAYIIAFAALFVAVVPASSGYAMDGFPAGPSAQAFLPNVVQSEELQRLTNQSRIAQGLLPLISDATLMRLAQEHAEEMSKQGFISHDIPSGNIFARMNRAGYKYETARENLARARMVSYAHSALLESPGHKENILATDISHIGIGIAKGDPAVNGDYLYIVEVFASLRNDYEPSQIKESLAARLEKARMENMASTRLDSTFEKTASGLLGALVDSYTMDDLRASLAKSADELRNTGDTGISGMYLSVQRIDNPDEIEIPDAICRELAVMYGSAVRRIIDKNNRPAFLVLTLVGISR